MQRCALFQPDRPSVIDSSSILRTPQAVGWGWCFFEFVRRGLNYHTPKLSFTGTHGDARDGSTGKAGRVKWFSVTARGQTRIMLAGWDWREREGWSIGDRRPSPPPRTDPLIWHTRARAIKLPRNTEWNGKIKRRKRQSNNFSQNWSDFKPNWFD